MKFKQVLTNSKPNIGITIVANAKILFCGNNYPSTPFLFAKKLYNYNSYNIFNQPCGTNNFGTSRY